MKIAITGVIASGKSTILNRIKALGYKAIDADYIVSELYKKEEVINLIGNYFDCIKDNQIDKRILGNIIFNDLDKRLLLNSLVHPLIKDYIEQINDELIFIEVPLLFEAGFQKLFDRIILVYASKEVSINRLIKRNNLSYEEALIRVNTQMSCDDKIELSDYVIDNSNSIDESFDRLDEILKEI